MDAAIASGFIVAGYLLGSLASAVIVCRMLRLPDPRSGGSGNPGATNVLRIGGKFPAALTLAGDVLKGTVPVLAAGFAQTDPAVTMATGLCAFLGHLYPVFFGFRGGKGVATAFGVVVALDLAVFASMAITWLLAAAASRYASLGSLCAAVAAPITAWLLDAPAAYPIGLSMLALILFWRHRGNIQRLLAGTESKIGNKA